MMVLRRALRAARDHLPSLALMGLSVLLVGAMFLQLGRGLRHEVDTGRAMVIVQNGVGQFTDSVCGILSARRYGTGRYVCTAGAAGTMRDVGLAYDDATLDRLGKTFAEWRTDTRFLNGGLARLFDGPVLAGPVVRPLGWGFDAGYMDAVQLAFTVFGYRVEAFHQFLCLMLALSTGLLCIQFFNHHLALFAALCFHGVVTYVVMHKLEHWHLYGANNPRFLSLLAILPLLHALFLVAYRVPPTRRAVLLFLPQAALVWLAGDARALAFWSVIALAMCAGAHVGIGLWRRVAPPRRLLALWWPAGVVLGCVAVGFLATAKLADPRIASAGGLSSHTFWQPFYYNLQVHPGWADKYGAAHRHTSGDETTLVAVENYRRIHDPNPDVPLTHRSYENFTRTVFLNFVRDDPWFVIETKYYNTLEVIRFINNLVREMWTAVDWRFGLLAAAVALAVTGRLRRGEETFSMASLYVGAVVACAILSIGPPWATVPNVDLLVDMAVVCATALLLLVPWAAVGIGLLLRRAVAARR